ncbi:MAG: ParB/RepB/Spo0J family partition protein [Candidatus Magasanikbacteria bacterium]
MALGKGLGSLIPQQKIYRRLKKEMSAPPHRVDQIWHIPLTEIVPNEHQPRKEFAHQDLEDLVSSIKKHGIIQPITVTEKEDGGYELIAGERRFRAAEVAGLATVPATVRSASRQEMLELALIENIQRQDLNPIEEGFAYKRLMDEFGLTQQEVADGVGKSRSQVANLMRLLDLPDPIQKALIDGKINVGKARAILGLKDEIEQLRVFKEMTGEQVTVRDVERSVAQSGGASRKGSVRRDPNILAQEEMIEERLGSKVQISKKGDKGTITIHYYSNEELKRLIDELT